MSDDGPPPPQQPQPQRSRREMELEEIRQKQLAKSWKESHGDATSLSALPTMDDFNAEQRRLTEETRLSQLRAAESLHQYRGSGSVSETERKRREDAEHRRMREMEAREGLHGYRANVDALGMAGGGNGKVQKQPGSVVEADVKAGERREDDDAIRRGLAGMGGAYAHDGAADNEGETVTSDSPTSPSASIPANSESSTTVEDQALGYNIASRGDTGANANEAQDARTYNTDANAAPPPSIDATAPQSSCGSTDDLAGLPVVEIADANDNSNRLMRENIEFTFGLKCNADMAPPIGVFADQQNVDATARGSSGGDGWAMLEKIMAVADRVVSSAIIGFNEKSTLSDGNDVHGEHQPVESVLYDSSCKPIVVEIGHDASFQPPQGSSNGGHRGAATHVRRIVKASAPIYVRVGSPADVAVAARMEVLGALRVAVASGVLLEEVALN